MDPHQKRPPGSQPPSFIRTPVSDQTSGSVVSVPSGSSRAKPRSTPMTPPPPRRGRRTAATPPTCRRPTVPSSARDRTSPASMSTHRRPPQDGDQTGPSPWWAPRSVICCARPPVSASAGEAVVVVALGGLTGLLALLLDLALDAARPPVPLRRRGPAPPPPDP